MKRKIIPHGAKLPVKLSTQELDLIREEPFLPDYDFMKLAPLEGDFVQLKLSLDDIEDLQGYVAAAANHSENKKAQRKLDRLCDKLQVFLDTYDDQTE